MADRKLPPSGGERKRCKVCKKRKALAEFYQHANNQDGRLHKCKSCISRSQKARRTDPLENEKMWGLKLARQYGITAAEYYSILSDQGGGCAICGKSPEQNGQRLAVDHDHDTKHVRGILCSNCNLSLGYMGDSVPRLRNAITYLSRS
jgi:hypothetical protein